MKPETPEIPVTEADFMTWCKEDLAAEIPRLHERISYFMDRVQVRAVQVGGLRTALEEVENKLTASQQRCARIEQDNAQLERERDEALRELAHENCVKRDALIRAERYYDCHGGPGTTQGACGACVTCLQRELADVRAKLVNPDVFPIPCLRCGERFIPSHPLIQECPLCNDDTLNGK